MSSLPRGFCSLCGLEVALRRGGLAREHDVAGASRKCRGSGALALKKRPSATRVAQQRKPSITAGDYVSARKLRPDGPGRRRGKVEEIRGGLILLAVDDELHWVPIAGARKVAAAR